MPTIRSCTRPDKSKVSRHLARPIRFSVQKSPPSLSSNFKNSFSLTNSLPTLVHSPSRSFVSHSSREREREREGDMTRLIRFSVQKSPLSLSRILLYILVRSFFIHLEREMARPIRFSVQKSPPLFLFEFQKFTLSLSLLILISKKRERDFVGEVSN